jgi:hypothetical protein
MDTILLELPDNYESNSTIWIYKDKIDLYNKYNQIPMVIQEKIIKPKEEVIKPKEEVIKPKEEVIKPKEEVIKPKEEVIRYKEGDKKTPLDLIINYTSTSLLMKNEIKQKLIELITIPEFAKAFGVKKSAEIISALTRNSWNQSMVLFISFFLDVAIVYKEKNYIFNKEKKLKEIVL